MDTAKKKTDIKDRKAFLSKIRKSKEKSLLKKHKNNIKTLNTTKTNKKVQFKHDTSIKSKNEIKSDSNKNNNDKNKYNNKEEKLDIDNKIKENNSNNKEKKDTKKDETNTLKKDNSKNKIRNKNKNSKDNIFKKSKSIKINEEKKSTKSKYSSSDKPTLVENMLHTINKSKETLSTFVDTISTEKDKNEDLNIIQKNQDEYNFTLESEKEKKKSVFTPIPSLIKKSSKIISSYPTNIKDVEKAINLRRIQYNEYLKSLHKPKPKPKPKPKIYDADSVIEIQKLFRKFKIKDINQTVNRLKINLCVTELLCLIFNHVFKHARRRITFYTLKTFYHDPFTNIFEEVDFTDKMMMKLSDTFYNFNNFFVNKTI